MEIKEFIASLERLNFSLSVENGNLNLKGDKTKLTKEEIAAIKVNRDVIDYIKANKNKLIEYLSGSPASSSEKKTKNISSIYRLSGLQEGMLFHGLYNQGDAYIEQVCCNISNVNIQAFEKSWNYVLKQHSILRSAFFYDEFNVAVQAVYKEVKLPLEVIDHTSLDEAAKESAIKEFESAERSKGFEFKEPPLMRIALLKLSQNKYRLIWTSHHLLFDGWSMPVILEEFLTSYELLIAEKPIAAKEEDKYEDYIRYVERIDKSLSKEYWSGYLKDLQQNTLLPFVVNSNGRTKGEGDYKTAPLQLESAISVEIQNFAKKHRLTINTLVQGVWSLLLHNYTGSKHIVYGVIVSGRPDDLAGVEKRVGLYINTLPLYSSVEGNPVLLDWLQGIQNDQVKSRQHQYAALHEIKRWTGIQGDLFDSLLVFENYPVSKLVSANKWSLRFDSVEMHEHTNYPLTILVNSSDDISIQFSYNSHLLPDFYIQQIQKHFRTVLLQLVNNSITSLNDIQLLTIAERNVLVNKFDNRQVRYPEDQTIVTIFEDQVQKTPDHIAVVLENNRLTYRELNEKSNRLANYLLSRKVKTETLVPICLERSLEMIVGILGILKAGCAYVPIDPDYPEDRISYMLNDISADFVVTTRLSRQKFSSRFECEIVEIDETNSLIQGQPSGNPSVNIRPDNLAYIIYTSGSTGKPKGVMIEHKNVVRLFKTDAPLYDFNDKDVWSLFHSFSFDFSVWEIFGALFYGGKLVIVSKEVSKDASLLAELILKEKITVLNQTPSAFYVLQDQLVEKALQVPVRYAIFGGEALNPAKLKQWKQYYPDSKLINMYGITETTVHVTYQEIDRTEIENGNSIIGKPIPTLSCLILDQEKNVVPIGVAGELYVGGAGVARGYLNRKNLTAEKFIKDPFTNEGSALLYRTGDLGKYLPDGNIEYLGRIDDQVKIRGYRIELGEIESVLQQSGFVLQSVVLAKQDTRGNKRLIGYVVSNGEFNSEEIINYLHQRLPEYMVPTLWVEVERMPLTSNGKIDKKALPDPGLATVSHQKYVEPGKEIEKKLAEIWQELLGVDRVGIYDNFFELGGHSILAMQVISFIRRKLKLEASIKDLFLNPTIAAFSEILLAANNLTLQPSIKVVNPRPENVPLSFSQERLWFIDQLEGSVPYHIPAVFRLNGKLDVQALDYSIRKIVDRHEVLRTVIREQDGSQYQQILASDGWNLNINKIETHNSNISTEKIQEIINQPFNLSTDYVLRADLIALSDTNNILVVTMHHLASDGWSMAIIVKEVVELYQSYIQKRSAKLEPLPVQYADYSIWQRSYLQGEVLDKKINYWKEKLREVAPLNLPVYHQKPLLENIRGDIEYFSIDKDLLQKIHSLGQKQEATLFMTLLTAFKILLYRYSRQEDICVGTPTANRTHKEVEGLVGLFLNTLALRTDVRSSDSFFDLLSKVKKTTLEAYEHQDVPFEKVVEAVVKERDLNRSPLFQVMFILQNTPEVPVLQLGDVELIPEKFEDKTSKFDLTFNVRETNNGLQGLVHYRTDLFAKSTVESLLKHFSQLLMAIVDKPFEKVGAYSFLSSAETNKILREFNRPLTQNLADKNLVDLFEEQVSKTPENIALIFGRQSLSYDELNKRSNQLARFLVDDNVKKGTVVPICIDRSFEMMIGIIAVLKAGAAYVPIDPDYPAERISYMLSDTDASIVLTSEHHASKLQTTNGKFRLIVLDSGCDRVEKQDNHNLNITISGEDLAYVLYTSGSTGKPKGVQIEHNSIAQHLKWFTRQYHITQKDSSLLISSFSFDGALTAIWPVLIAGGSLHLPTENELDPASVLQYINHHSITYLKTLPGIFSELICADNFTDENWCTSLRLIILGGEKIKMNDLKTYLSYYPNVIFSNHYGPTECTVSSSFFIIDKNNAETVHPFSLIGKPVDNTNIYVVDEEGLLNPIGVPGEIWISGVGVARGYLNSEELSKQKFILNPFISEQPSRVYKTGDVGRWLPDGNLEFIGRKDEQVKIRGYRVELGEIEDALKQSVLIREAVVIARENGVGTTNLVAYVVPEETFEAGTIIEFLKAKLPGFMIPGLWVKMESLPLSANGKIDRNALPEPNSSADPKNKDRRPGNKTEQAIADIWKELLGLDEVGVYDNFFEVGGHSLLAIRVISSIRKKLQTELSIKSIFLYPTVEKLANYIRKQEKGILLPSIKVEQRPDRIPLSFSQERLWFIHQLEGSVQYHIPAVLRLRGKLDIQALASSLKAVVNRHEILRTVIVEDHGRPFQRVLNDELELEYLKPEKLKDGENELELLILQLIKKPFDLAKDLMVRAALIELNKEEHILVLTTHHIASDGWSTSIFVKEVIQLYEGYLQQQQFSLPTLDLQFADYAIWQRNYLQGDVLNKKINFWKEKLKDVPPLDIPTDFARPAIQGTKGNIVNFSINKDLTNELILLTRQQDATLFMTLLTAFKILLLRYSGQPDICVGTPVAGRMQEEVEGLIGFFLNTLALRTELDAEESFIAALRKVKETALEAFEQQDVPFEKVVEAVVTERDLSRKPIFQVMFVLQNTPELPDINLPDISLKQEVLPHNTSMFDLTLSLTETNIGLNGAIEYSTDLFSKDSIERFIHYFKNLLSSLVRRPGAGIRKLSITDVEQQQLLKIFNNQQKDYTSKTIVELFEEEVAKSPDNIALIFKEQQLTYSHLNECANRLACHLRSKGVKEESCVPICVERGIELIVGILGILKAGGAYVPIDIEYPAERIKFMLDDISANLIVASSASRQKLQEIHNIEFIEINKEFLDLNNEFSNNFEIATKASSLAYIIYTSGSTGRPKGVMVEHGNVVSLVKGVDYVTLTNEDVLLSTGSPSFDATTFEYWGMLLNGGQLVLPSENTLLDAGLLKSEIIGRQVTKMWFTSSWFNQLVETDITVFSGLQTILVGGEKLSENHIKKVRQKFPSIEIINGYGPTENTTFSLTYKIEDEVSNKTIPIGRPLSNRTAFIVDLGGQLAPIGVPGEILVGGPGLSRGYLNRPELTAEKFIVNPFDPQSGRLYKTGDLGRLLPDGNIEYRGRMDEQVKIRGFRIELGEIESVLQQIVSVTQSVVIAKEDFEENKQLVAYVIPGKEYDQSEIILYLKSRLPAYMIPAFLVELESFPLTTNGKINVRALPDPKENYGKSQKFNLATSATEKKLVEIWQEVLGLKGIGIEDNFFQLGGHSLMVMQLKSKIHEKLNVELEIKDLFQFPTIKEISKFIEIQLSGRGDELNPSEEFELLVI